MSEFPEIPQVVREFLADLCPDDVGITEIDDWIIHYEGFGPECLADVERRMRLPESDPGHAKDLQDALELVLDEFSKLLGSHQVEADILHGDQPIVYAIGYKAPTPEVEP